jgi:hypothetical protein
MGDLLRFDSADGSVLVEEREGADLERAGLLDRIRPAKQRLEGALQQIRPAADATIKALSDLDVAPDSIELELGVTLTAEAGAVVARTTAEGHLIVRVTWTPGAGTTLAAGDSSSLPN